MKVPNVLKEFVLSRTHLERGLELKLGDERLSSTIGEVRLNYDWEHKATIVHGDNIVPDVAHLYLTMREATNRTVNEISILADYAYHGLPWRINKKYYNGHEHPGAQIISDQIKIKNISRIKQYSR